MEIRRKKFSNIGFIAVLIFALCYCIACIGETIIPLKAVTDLNIGESIKLELNNGESVEVALLDTEAVYDELRNAVRSARDKVSVNGYVAWLDVANYNMSVTIENIQIDCPVGIEKRSTAENLASRLSIYKPGDICISYNTTIICRRYSNGE